MTMVLPLSHGSCPDVFPMPCGFDGSEPVDFDAVESSLASSDWIMPSALPGLDAGLGYPAPSAQDNNNNNKDSPGSCPMAAGVQEASVDWPVGTVKRKADETSTTEPELCGLFFQPAKRLSLVWNTKLRLKEERKRVLKLSITKLRQIDDPELFLRRSVLINNTIKRLHREIREEKLARLGRPRHNPDSLTSCALEPFPRRRPEPMDSHPTPAPTNSVVERTVNAADDPLCKRLRTENEEDISTGIGALQQRNLEPINICSESNGLTTLGVSVCNTSQHGNITEIAERPPAITKTEAVVDTKLDSRYDYGVPYSSSRERIVSDIEKQYSGYSCGQSSIFGELQSVVFHSLIASLES